MFRTSKESMLTTIELFFTSILFGYVFNHFFNEEEGKFHSDVYFHYWVIIDCILMLFTIGYGYAAKYLQIEGEITRNVYTLVFLQDKRLLELEKDEETLAEEAAEKKKEKEKKKQF